MNILLVSERLGRSSCIQLGRLNVAIALVALLAVLPAVGFYAGYHWGSSKAAESPLAQAWEAEMGRQRAAIEKASQTARDNLDALALRMGQMQAHVIRLDALGQRLTQMAGLDDGEFDFENPPAQGGPEAGSSTQPLDVPDFLTQLDGVMHQLDDRDQQLKVLESMLLNRKLQAEVLPAGRPIKGGWISSQFGLRTDPFNGKLERHNGMDFAGKEGSKVVAVAAGVVTWAGERFGYGNLVEINHGNGYATRYGHNKAILVKVGDAVKKGQTLALMGSTGRSTGPHVHFEVLHNGRAVNPSKYIQATR